MKSNGEWERKDIEIDREMEVLDDGHSILAYMETWFDVDKKFGTHTADDDSEWVELCAKFDPFKDTLEVTYTVSRDDGSLDFPYTPTPDEAHLLKDMISKKIYDVHGQTPQEFCQGMENTDITMGGIS